MRRNRPPSSRKKKVGKQSNLLAGRVAWRLLKSFVTTAREASNQLMRLKLVFGTVVKAKTTTFCHEISTKYDLVLSVL
jgi:hypothetical protein